MEFTTSRREKSDQVAVDQTSSRKSHKLEKTSLNISVPGKFDQGGSAAFSSSEEWFLASGHSPKCNSRKVPVESKIAAGNPGSLNSKVPDKAMSILLGGLEDDKIASNDQSSATDLHLEPKSSDGRLPTAIARCCGRHRNGQLLLATS